MSSSVDKSSSSKSLLSGQNIVYAGIAWAVLALLFYLLFSISVPGEERPFWYSIGTYMFEELAFLAAAGLCWRNFRSPQIASGSNVWLGIGLGMLSYFIGNLVFGWWELVWGLDPEVSPADLFFIAFYLFLGWGMTLAILPRRLNLETWQWGTVATLALAAVVLAFWLSVPANAAEANAVASTPVTRQVSAATSAKPLASYKTAPTIEKGLAPKSSVRASSIAQSPPANNAEETKAPSWVLSLEAQLEPLGKPLGFLYIFCDVAMLIIAALLLLAFWGGRFAQSWRMIAAAAFSFYIADMWFKYATDRIADYQSGFLLEVFWVFSGVLFAIGAALEYDNSMRSRRDRRKRA